jgi:hypothetical protein
MVVLRFPYPQRFFGPAGSAQAAKFVNDNKDLDGTSVKRGGQSASNP